MNGDTAGVCTRHAVLRVGCSEAALVEMFPKMRAIGALLPLPRAVNAADGEGLSRCVDCTHEATRMFTNAHVEDGHPMEVVSVHRAGTVSTIRTEGVTDSRAEAFLIANVAAEREGVAHVIVWRQAATTEDGRPLEISRHAVHCDGFRKVEAAEHDEALCGGFQCAADCPECAAAAAVRS